MDLKPLVVLFVCISASFGAPALIKSLPLKADKSILEGLECGVRQKVMEGEQYYFRSRPYSRIPRSSPPLAYWFQQPPPQHPQNRYPSLNQFSQNSFHNAFSVDHPQRTGFGQTYIRPRVCKWIFETNGNCQLIANFDHYESGDLNCNRQYLLFGDEDRDIQVCGYAPFPGHFKSNGNSLYIKHFRKPGTWGADFEGFVSCIKRRYEPEIIEYGLVSGEVKTNNDGIKELETIVEAELEESDADAIKVVDDNGLEPPIDITEVKEGSTYSSPNDEVEEAKIYTEKKEEGLEFNGIEPRDEESADASKTPQEGYIEPATSSPEYVPIESTPEEKPLYPTAKNDYPQTEGHIPTYQPTTSNDEAEIGTVDQGTQTEFSPDASKEEIVDNYYTTQPPSIYEVSTEPYKPEESEQYPTLSPTYRPEYKSEEESEQYQASTPTYKPSEESEQYQAPSPTYRPDHKSSEEPEQYQGSSPTYKPAEDTEQYHDSEPKPGPKSDYKPEAPQAPEYKPEETVNDEPQESEYADSKYKHDESKTR